MAETGLNTQHPCAEFTVEFDGAVLSVLSDKELLSVDFPRANDSSVKAALGALPAPGHSAQLPDGQTLLWVGIGQCIMFCAEAAVGEVALAQRLENVGYVTDISDGWIALSLAGPRAQDRLALLALPDLSDQNFAVGAVTSTVIAHVRVVIWRQTAERYVLLSAASSARSLTRSLRHELSLHDTILERSQ